MRYLQSRTELDHRAVTGVMDDQGNGRAAAHSEAAYLLPAPAFERVLTHERALSDRSGEPFAVLRFEVAAGARARVETLIAAATQRVRATDVLGWLASGEFVVLLRYASVEDALRVGRSIRTLAEAAPGEFTCSVHGHPPFHRGESRTPAAPSLTLHVAGQPEPR